MPYNSIGAAAGTRILVAMIAAHLLAGELTAATIANDLPNDSFEQMAPPQPANWKTHLWGGEGQFLYEPVGRQTGHSVAIASEKGADASWYLVVAAHPYSTYRLSGWIKTDKVIPGGGKGALLNVHGLPNASTPAIAGTRDWTRVEVVFDTEEQESLHINCLLGGWGMSTGKAWYDDLKLERLSSRILKPTIAIQAQRTGEPISKYIYGQFIEHLGRCIYGGIWAEMLEDRKFFDPVGSDPSPWKTVASAATVQMTRDNPFVGLHSPEISLPGGADGGIVQGGLALRQGKHYVGRIWLAGKPQAGPVRVSLVWGNSPAQRQTIEIPLTPAYTKSALEFVAAGATDDGRLEIVSAGKGIFRIGTLSLMPADNVRGMRADTLQRLKELDAPVYRWPGGNFVSGYNFKDGIGDPDRRPPRKNPAWKGIEHNDFGIDEYLAFCREIKTEPLIVVNSGLGSVDAAVEELQYANSSPATPGGKLRADNGHPQPYGVKFWGIGNEMYGDWQLGHIPLDQYVPKNNSYASAMRKVDPSIVLIAVGNVGPWSEGMLKGCADQMNLISEHFYCGQQQGLIAHARQVPDQVRRIAEAHRQYRKTIPALHDKMIRIALDEWNYWYGDQVFGELGTRYFLKDALGIAAGLNEFARQSDIYFMANYAQTVNVIGAIKTSKTDASLETTGLVLKLYRHHFGAIPVKTAATAPLDVAAAWSADRRTLTIAAVNPTRDSFEVPLDVQQASLAGDGRLWLIAGTDPMAYNEPGKPPKVTILQSHLQGLSNRLPIPPLSISLFELNVKSP